MQTMQPILKRGRDVWDPINLPQSEFQERTNNIKNIMLQNGIDVLLLYGNGIDQCNYPCYVSNYAPTMPGGVMAVLSPKHEGCIVLAEISSRDLPYAKQTTSTDEVRPCQNVVDECIRYLTGSNLIPATIGLAGLEAYMPYYQYRCIHNSLSACKLVNCEHILDRVMMLKSSRECDQIRRAGRIISNGFELLQGTMFTDLSELALEAHIERTTFLEGAEDCRVLLSRSLSNDYLLNPADNVQISSRQTITIYLAVRYERYWAEAIRTLQFADHCFRQHPDGKPEKIYKQIIEIVQPGKKSSDLLGEITAKLKQENIKCIPGFEPGGGIGLSRKELPLLNEEDTTILREGMTITLRLAVDMPGPGVVMMGNTLNIIGNKTEVLAG
jgi:Xaa-Pro aminopeptidase